MSIAHKQVKILGISIRENNKGSYCINDLWKASGKGNKDRPSIWLSNIKTKQFISLVDQARITASVVNFQQGNELITFAVPEVFLDYASWLKPEVKLAAYQALLSKMGELNSSSATHSKQKRLPPKAKTLETSHYASIRVIYNLNPSDTTRVLDSISTRVNIRRVITEYFDREIEQDLNPEVVLQVG
jgi:hypothetical protein